ncbi:Pyrroline-5-carboxylate reductase [Sphingomonas sp. EC-HK361]|uniref:pyrroline-5-carboxylate reductase family protein n=1 Tax=Sphingomonas sp. EC-HK361 TaxID=2038397 RepID=UPI001259F046|nr:pyrroline-5-carboxylate reductase dimerization domain-containing protein [Sphingomonas sp. EC-HK361]VVT12953.1 Pyrroline-5-carboxylate reductase [Sphingomonas sp. EC-HK361]
MSVIPPAGARILLVGAGNMGGAMLRGWLKAGTRPDRITVVSPSLRAMPDGVRVVAELPTDSADEFDVVALALKPQQLGALRTPAFAALAPRLLLSVLAGVEIATLVPMCAAQSVVRAMPNLPIAIGRGVIALHGGEGDAEGRALAEALVTPLGHVEWIGDEALFDVVTALAGSGPGFLFRFVDALGAAGAALGIPADQAARLALAMVAGSAAMAEAADASPAVLADRVASKGGSTREGLNVLDRDGALVRLLTETLEAATRRNREMAEAARRG